MQTRPLQRKDSAALLEMWNATARFDPLTPSLLEEKIHGDDAYDPELVLVSEASGEIQGFAMGVIQDAPQGRRGVVKLMAAAADRRRCGIGSDLLARLEQALAARGARVMRICESPPNYLTPGVDSRYSAAPHFFKSHAYRRIGQACNMSVELQGREFGDEDQETLLAERGVELRRAGLDDRSALAVLLQLHWPSWMAEADRALHNEPSTLFIAVEGGHVTGFAAWDANNRGTGWFGPMGTEPAARGQGIGRLLLFRCLRDMGRTGLSVATIPWVDPVDFYSQCAGAAVTRIFNRYEKELPA